MKQHQQTKIELKKKKLQKKIQTSQNKQDTFLTTSVKQKRLEKQENI